MEDCIMTKTKTGYKKWLIIVTRAQSEKGRIKRICQKVMPRNVRKQQVNNKCEKQNMQNISEKDKQKKEEYIPEYKRKQIQPCIAEN